jgi:hypothetical protein
MATGDQSDVVSRLQSWLPSSWFGGSSPILTALLQAPGYVGSLIYSLYAYAKNQARIKTATDGWLDLIAADFFGPTVFRQQGELDASFRGRIVANMFRARATRQSIVDVMVALTGRTPAIFEPLRVEDTGAYNQAATLAYGLAGGYGSLAMPFQAFVTAYRQSSSGVPNVAGYGVSVGAYNTPSQIEYASLDMSEGAVSDAAIFAAVDSVRPIGSKLWTRISS